MSYKVRVAAARDLDEAGTWYRDNAHDPRIAVRFLLTVRERFETIAESPTAFPVVHRDVRRCRVLTFPAYSIFYRVLAGTVVIIAVFHGKRRPSWQRRR